MLRRCVQCDQPFEAFGRRKTCSEGCYHALKRAVHYSTQGRNQHDSGGLIPVAPILPWLHEQLETVDGPEELAEHLEVSTRTLYEWLHGRRLKSSLDTVDRMFCRAGQPWLLRELYPELYEAQGIAA